MTKIGGRPPHEPSADSMKYVEALASFGVPQADICGVLGVSEKTLRKHYGDILDTAAIKANARVAQALFQKATKGEGQPAVTAAIFWLKTRAGWKETTVNEHTGKDGGPIATEDATATVDLTKVSKDQRATLRQILQQAVGEKPN